MDVVIMSLATLIGLYMAANIGGNDLANAMGTSVGSGALTLKQAVLISIIANTSGAVIAGGHVTATISKGMIDPSHFNAEPAKLMLGMFAALASAGLWVNIATVFGLPVSTTHAIVGAVVGFGVLSVGVAGVTWSKILTVVASWVVSPLAGALIAATIYRFLEKKILSTEDPYGAAERYAPFLIFLVLVVLIVSVVHKGLRNLHLQLGFIHTALLAVPAAAVAASFARRYVRWHMGKQRADHSVQPVRHGHTPVERLFAHLQVLTACYVAFAHGANDVANAAGPVAAIFSVIKTKSVALHVEVPLWLLLIGGLAVGGGLLAVGTRVMETIGKNITEITPARGFCAEFGAATTILLCSRLGLPVSTTHVLVGSVVGVGLVRGMGALDLRILKNIGFSWLVTLPFTMGAAMLLYGVLTAVLL